MLAHPPSGSAPSRRSKSNPVLRLTQLEDRSVPAIATEGAFLVGSDEGLPNQLKVIDATGAVIHEQQPYDAGFMGGVRVALGDLTGDGVPDLVTAPGPGTTSLIRAFDGDTGENLWDFVAFEEGFEGGSFVTLGDFDGDGLMDCVISPDVSGGPRVRVISGQDRAILADFYGIEDENFRGGVRCGVGDLTGDGQIDLLVGAGFGGGPRVALFDGASLNNASTPTHVVGDFYVFEPTLRNGTYLAAGDLNGDGYAELVAGAGPGGGPRVLALDGRQLVEQGSESATQVLNFFAGDPADRSGVRVSVSRNAAEQWSVLTAPGLNGGSRVNVYDATGAETMSVEVAPYAGSFVAGDAAVTPPGTQAIQAAYLQAGGPAGALGTAVTRPTRTEGGTIQRFENGVIGWTRDTGAVLVDGEVFELWVSVGAEGVAGIPLRVVQGDGGHEMTVFQHAAIIRDAAGRLTPVVGPIFDKWLQEGADKTYGLPTDERVPADIPGGLLQRFQNGVVYWSPDSGAVGVIDPGTVYISPFHFPIGSTATGGDGFNLWPDPSGWKVPTTWEDVENAVRPQDLEDPVKDVAVAPYATSGSALYTAAAVVQVGRFPDVSAMSRTVKRFLLTEFGNVFSEQFLNNVRLHWGAVPYDIMFHGGSAAQTFGYDIFITANEGTLSERDEITLIAHELMHTLQMERYGGTLASFGYMYFQEHAKAGFSYSGNPLEKEAYELDDIVGKRWDARKLADAQASTNHYLRIQNDTGEPLTIYLQYRTTPDGFFLTDPSYWEPEDRYALTYSFGVGEKAILLHNGSRVEANRIRIWAESDTTDHVWAQYKYQDYVLGDNVDINNIHTLAFVP